MPYMIFEEDFASAHDWVKMYRTFGLQAVPAMSPRDDNVNYKRPAVAWKEFEDTPIPDATIERWYEPGGPHRMRTNVGLITGACSGGVFCVDLDVKDGSHADAWWLGLIETHNNGLEPETPWQRTGGGGRQILFRAPNGWAPPTFKTPIGIDIRGQGGFMVCPPSMHASGKRYEWAPGCAPYDMEPEFAPEWLIEAIDKLRLEHGGGPAGVKREHTASDADKNAFGLDEDNREEKLQKWVWAAVVDLYRAAPIPPSEAEQEAEMERLWQLYLMSTTSRINRPGIDKAHLLEIEGRGRGELERKWRYAMKKWDKEVAAAAAIPKSENEFQARAANDEAKAEEGKEEEVRQAGLVNATQYAWIEASKIPPRDLLYGRHLFRKFLSATVAPGGLGKSSLVMVDALAAVTGRDLIGDRPKAALSVWYWNGEDPLEELQRRIAAACLHYRITEADLGGRLFVDSGRDTEIVVVRETKDGVQIATPIVDAMVEQVRSRNIDIMTIDPFVACHAVNENDNAKIEAVVKQWMRVAEEGGCAIELVHHVRKPSGAGIETTVDDARGAGALLAKVRSARVLNGMATAEAMEIGIDAGDRWAYFRVDNGKANLMPRGGDAKWHRMVGVPLGNRVDAQEDNVGVATAWIKPGMFDGIKEHHLYQVRAAVAGGEWRFDVQCSNWVGHAIAGVLGLDSNEQADRQRIKSMLKFWIKNNVLEVVDAFDHQRKLKKHVIVGKEIE